MAISVSVQYNDGLFLTDTLLLTQASITVVWFDGTTRHYYIIVYYYYLLLIMYLYYIVFYFVLFGGSA